MSDLRVLALNLGSSSLIFALFGRGPGERRLAGGTVDDLDAVIAAVEESAPGAIDVVGHRIVHGGADHAAPERTTTSVRRSRSKCLPFVAEACRLARRVLGGIDHQVFTGGSVSTRCWSPPRSGAGSSISHSASQSLAADDVGNSIWRRFAGFVSPRHGQ